MKSVARIHQYLEYKGIKPTRFEKEVGLSNGYLGTQLKRNADLGEGVLNKILDYCLDIDPEWLLTGRGDMIKRLPPEPPAAPSDAPDQGARTDKMLDIIKEQAGQIGQLQNRINELTEQNHKLTMELINAPGESENPKERRMESPGSAVRRP